MLGLDERLPEHPGFVLGEEDCVVALVCERADRVDVEAAGFGTGRGCRRRLRSTRITAGLGVLLACRRHPRADGALCCMVSSHVSSRAGRGPTHHDLDWR